MGSMLLLAALFFFPEKYVTPTTVASPAISLGIGEFNQIFDGLFSSPKWLLVVHLKNPMPTKSESSSEERAMTPNERRRVMNVLWYSVF